MDNQTGHAQLNGTELNFQVAGAGKEVVFIHGMGSDLRLWDDQFDTFARQFRVLRYDLRGFGKSAVPTDEPYCHADDLKALLDHVGFIHPHLIGQSMGGEIALNFAVAYPEQVKSLVLVDTTLGGYEWSQEWTKSWMPIYASFATDGKDAGLRLLLDHPLFASAAQKPVVIEQLNRIFSDYSGWHMLNPDPVQYPEPPAIQRLEQLNIPTLIIVAEYDLPDFHSIASLLQSHMPDARKVILSGVGHVVPMEAADQLNEIVFDFLGSQPYG